MNEKAVLEILRNKADKLRSQLEKISNLESLTIREEYKIKVQIEVGSDSPLRYSNDLIGEGISLSIDEAENNALEDYMKKNGKYSIDTHAHFYYLSFGNGSEIRLDPKEIEKIKAEESVYQKISTG